MEYTGIFPDDIRALIPPIGSQDGKGAKSIVYTKFFTPWANWTWYVIDGEPILDEGGKEVDFHFFGYVVGTYPEFGYFSLNELKSMRGLFDLRVERDMFWEPTPLELCHGFTP